MLAIVLVLAVVVAFVVHEVGHWLAAHALGGGRVSVKRIRWGAAVEADLDDDVRRVAFLLAGPFASAAFGVVLVVVGGWWGVVGAVSILFAVLTVGGSDGRQTLALGRALARARAKSNDSR